MSNPWSPPASNPLSRFVDFIRIQLAGAPIERVEEAVAGIEEHVAAEIRAAVAPLEAEIAALKGGSPTVVANGADALAELRQQVEEIRDGLGKVQSAASGDVSADLKKLHDRLTAVEAAAKPAAAQARAAAPAARPSAASA